MDCALLIYDKMSMLIKLVKKKRKHVAQIHAIERSENLGVCLVSKCIMLQDSDIGLQYTPTNIVTNYDMKTIESTKDLILKFLTRSCVTSKD